MRRFVLLASAAVLLCSSTQAQIITPSGGGGGGGSGITALTGDVTASGSGSVAATVVGAGGSTFSTTTGQTYTFPTTTATLARTDAAQTFTGLQTFAGITLGSASTLAWSGSRGIVSSPAAGKIQLGSLDAASPVAQFLKVQNVSTGTSNTAGADWTVQGSTGTGTGAGGAIIFQTAPAGSTGTAQNAFTTQFSLDPTVTVAATSVLCNDSSKVLSTDCSGTSPTFGATTVTSVDKWVFTAPTTAATLVAGGDSLTYTFPSSSVTLQGALVPSPISGNWFAPPFISLGTGTALTATGTASFTPFLILKTTTIKSISVRCTTLAASGNIQLAIYANNATTGRPTGSPVTSTNSGSTASTGQITPTTLSPATPTLTPGMYWLGIAADTNAGAVAIFQTQTSAIPLMSSFVGSATLANVVSANSTVSLIVTTPLTFNTWGDLTSATWTEAATQKGALPFLQVN